MTKILFKRGQAEANLPILDPGEPAITFESGGSFWIGTPSGNLEITGGGGGIPGGADTQVQFNDGGSFGGNSGFTFNKTTGALTLDAGGLVNTNLNINGSTDFVIRATPTDTLVIRENTAGEDRITITTTGVVINEGGLDRDLRIEGDTATNLVVVDSGLDAFQIGTTTAGLIADFRSSSIVFNETGTDIDFRIEGDTATSLFVTNAGLDAVQIGTTTAGNIADFRSSAIVFNEDGADRDFRIEGDTEQNLFFVDAGNDRVGIGTNSPTVKLEVSGQALFSAVTGSAGIDIFKAASSNEGGYFSVQDGSGTGFLPAFVFSSSGINVGGAFNALVGTDTNDVNRSAFQFSARNSAGTGALTNVDLFQVANYTTIAFKIWNNGGVTVGSPTGGSRGSGTINTAGDIYKNNSAYTNPDYALEYWASGKIEKYIDNKGARGYYRYSLDELEKYIKEHYRLPSVSDIPMGVFQRSDFVLEKIEELFTYVIELNAKIKELSNG